MLREKLIWLLLIIQISCGSALTSKWHYRCVEGFCERILIDSNTTSLMSQAECNILCTESAAIWPKPTGNVSVKNLVEIDAGKFFLNTTQNTKVTILVKTAFKIFVNRVQQSIACSDLLHKTTKSNLASVNINFEITDQDTNSFTLVTDESYLLEATDVATNIVNVTIKAETFYGARHALETLSQIVAYDDLRNRLLFPKQISISDKPAFTWRGLMLDTARNFVTPKAIKKTLTAMAASKLNIFHWHITDTASFPYVSKSHPELSEYGAYSPKKVYTDDIVRDIIRFGNVRGIRVVPELDAPAHVGEGWQNSGVVTCFNWKPWSSYCVEPPCGQFDPSKPELYDILEDIYGDMLEQFGNEVFHMGGDEINLGCWKNTVNLTDWMVNEKGWAVTDDDFLRKVWPYFQSEAAKRLYKKAGKEIPIILWDSELTTQENITDILPPSKYIIQIWSGGQSDGIQQLLENNYTIILSNYDALYLDCGFAGWVQDGNNWCSPYKGWQQIYNNKPDNIASERISQVLGGETALWTEQSGTNSLDSRLWPRAAAFAETLWTFPSSTWDHAEERMLIHRNRLVSLGIDAEEMQPEWCLNNQQQCPSTGRFNR